MNLNPCLTSYIKINSKYIKDLNLKARTTKLLEENIRVNLQKPGFGNGFLDMTSKHQQQKKKKKTGLKTTDKISNKFKDSPGCPGVGSLSARAGDMGLIPSSRGSPMPWSNQIHATKLLPSVTTTEACVPRCPTRETTMRSPHTSKSSPHLP